MTLIAAYASKPLNPARPVSHLFDGDTDLSLCGTIRGVTAPNVTCKACLHRYADTPAGRVIQRQAFNTAINHIVREAARPGPWEQVAQLIEQGATMDRPPAADASDRPPA